MSKPETSSAIVERDFPHAPEKLWRALTQPHLIEEWLMKNDFALEVGHHFKLRGDWGGVIDGEVLAVEPNKALSYTWDFSSDEPAFALKTVKLFSLLPGAGSTPLGAE